MPTLLLVHGFPFDARMWADQVAALSDVRSVLALDLPGHGADEGIPLESVDAMADFLASSLDAAGVDAVDLAGFSMGGYVAFAFWRRHRGRVRSLLLVDTRATAETDAGRIGRDEMRVKVRASGPSPVAEAMGPKLLTEAAPAHVREKVQGWMLESRPETVLADLLALRDRPDSVPSLPTIDVPTTILVGDQDQVTPLADSEQMAAGIKGARLTVVPGAAHLSPVEQPGAITDAIRSHLLTVPA